MSFRSNYQAEFASLARGEVSVHLYALLFPLAAGFFLLACMGSHALAQEEEPSIPETVVVGFDSDYPPYEFVKDGQYLGYNLDLIREVAKEMGFKLEFHPGPWSEVRQALKDGAIDMLAGMYYSKDRLTDFDFSTPHIVVSHAVFHRRDRHIDDLADLKNEPVLVQRDDIMHDYLREIGYEGPIVPVENQLEALRRLNSDSRYEVALLAKLQGMYLVREHGFQNIDVSAKAIKPREYCFAVKGENRILLAALNEGLAIIKTNGTLDTVRKRWFTGPDEPISNAEAARFVAWILVPLGLFLLVVLGWVSVLRWQVKRQTALLRHELEAREQAEKALLESHARQKAFVELAPYAIFLVDEDGSVVEANSRARDLYGYEDDEWNRLPISSLIPATLYAPLANLIAQDDDNPPPPVERLNTRKDGSSFPGEILTRRTTQDGKPRLVIYVRDISRRRQVEADKAKLEAQLRQSQRLESIGRLAGGIAHDFNNLLTSLSGNVELSRMELDEDHPVRSNLDEIQSVAERAAKLTNQLLAFSRRQIIAPRVVDLNRTLTDLHSMLRRLIGEDIQLRTLPAEDLWRCKVDPGQMEQVIVNLVVNSRDAMPAGGQLMIETGNVTLGAEYCETHSGALPGDYVMVAVSDTGMGMDELTKNRIFEPFFTTKEAGKGTGLGLSTVYGIVKQHGGGVEVYSEPGSGTTFKIYLPRVLEELPAPEKKSVMEDWPGGTEHILVVEDDDILRDLTGTLLRRLGYEVVVAANGNEAQRLASEGAEPFALMMTDVVMPGLNGKEVAAALKARFPKLKVLFASGYTENVIVHHGVLEEGVHFLGKPYTPAQLARKIRDILDREE